MSFYPILVELENQKVLVVGGGKVAQRKVENLIQYGAEILIVSQRLTGPLEQYVEDKIIRLISSEFDIKQLDHIFMVIAATDNAELNEMISIEAKKRGLLVNTVDQPSECNFIVPSIIRRGDLLVAVSTSGKSPALAKKIRKELDAVFGNEYKELLGLMGALRKKVLDMGLSQEENQRIFYELVDSPILEAVKEQDIDRLTLILNNIIKQNMSVIEVAKFLKAG